MFQYYLRSISYNRKRHLLILVISTIGLSFIFFIVQLISSLNQFATQMNSKSDAEEMLYLLVVFMVSMGASIVGILSAAYKIMYYGRKKEIQQLHQIGCCKKRINRIFLIEIIVLSLIVTCFSMFLGYGLTGLFEYYYNEVIQTNSNSVVAYLVISNLIFCYTVFGQFKKYRDEVLIYNTIPKTKTKKNAAYPIQLRNQFMAGGAVLLIYYFMKATIKDFQGIFQYIEEQSLDELLLTMVIFIWIRPIIYGICRGLDWIAGKFLIGNLHLAMKHILDEIESMMKLIINMIFSICLILFFLVLFHSTTSSTIASVNKSIKYSHRYIAEENYGFLQLSGNEEEYMSRALILSAQRTDIEKEITLIGITQHHQDAEQVEVLEGDGNSLFEQTGSELPALVSNIDAKNYHLKMNDSFVVITEEKEVSLKVVGIYNSYQFGDVYVNLEGLSRKVVQQPMAVNACYTDREIEDLNQTGILHETRDEIIGKTKASVLGGTEMVKAFLYLYVISSFFMLFNIFIISIKNRKTCNENLVTIGLTRERIFCTQFIEMLTISLLGILLGVVTAGVSIMDLPAIMKLLYGLNIQIYIPASVYIIMIGIITISIIEILIICHQAAKKECSLKLEVEGTL